jgi:hypothetical protein
MGAPKGHPVYEGAGRPQGSKNKNYVDPGFWTEKLIECYERATEKEKAELAKWYLTLLFSKMQMLPKTAEQSVENVNEILGAIKSGIVKVESANNNNQPEPIPSDH